MTITMASIEEDLLLVLYIGHKDTSLFISGENTFKLINVC